ncbi:MAG: ECF transporter S component [Bacillota bacterium]
MNVKKLVITALLITMSAVGGFIKIPSPTGTVAFDSLPGYLAAALLGGCGGADIAITGSTEENTATCQSGPGVSVIGKATKSQGIVSNTSFLSSK